jgi:hypothetical protein
MSGDRDSIGVGQQVYAERIGPNRGDVAEVLGADPDHEAEEPDNGPGDVGEPSDFDRRAAALHMALRLNEIRGYAGVSIVETLIEEADKIHAFLKGETPK